MRRAALVAIQDSPTIARTLARVDRLLRIHLEQTFPHVGADTLDALEVLASWDAWNRLRTAQGCSVARARHVLLEVMRRLIEREVA